MTKFQDLLPYANTDRQREMLVALDEHGSYRKAAKAIGGNHSNILAAVKKIKDRAAIQGHSPEHDMTHTAPDTHFVKGVSTFYDDKGKPRRQWVKTDIKKEALAKAMAALVEGLKADLGNVHVPVPSPECPDDDLLACYMMGDHHLGMKADPGRTGGDDWDLDIAEDVVVRAVANLASKNHNAKHALLANLGDFFHANDSANVTPASKHALDVDKTFAHAIRTAARIYRSIIQILLEAHETVTIINARGNHDQDAALWLNEMLKELYAQEPRLHITDNTTKFVHHRWGTNLIVTHHGDRIKPEKLCEHATRNLAKDWGECEHRFGWMGHIHHASSKELGYGMTVESWSVLCAPDAYAADHGYGQQRSMSCVVLHRHHGEDCRYKVGIKELKYD